MQISRRDFIHAGCAASVATLVPRQAYAAFHGSAAGAPTGHKGQVNLNIFGTEIDFPFLNAAKGAGTFSVNNATQDKNALLDASGYPTAIPSGTSNWTSNTFVDFQDHNSSFTGSITGTALTVSGSVTGVALFIGQTVSGTGITAGTRIVSGSGTSWVVSNSMAATGSITILGFVPLVVDWVGAANGVSLGVGGPFCDTFPTTISAQRVEYRLPSKGNASFTGSISGQTLTITSAVTGTIIDQMTLTSSSPGLPTGIALNGQLPPFDGTVWFLTNNLSYSLTTIPIVATGAAVGNPMLCQVIVSSVATALSNLRVFWQNDETRLNAGFLLRQHFIDFYKPYGRLRFMNWQMTNGSMLANWTQRTKLTDYCWDGTNPTFVGAYSGMAPVVASGNDYIGLNAVTGNPSAWVDGMTVQATLSNNPAAVEFTGHIDNGSGGAGNTLTVTAVTRGALAIGQSIRTYGGFGSPSTCTITAGSGTSWTVDGGTQNTGSLPMLAYSQITGMTTNVGVGSTMVTSPNHGFANGDVVFFPVGEIVSSGGTGIDGHLNALGGTSGTNWTQTYTVASATTNTFILSGVDSTGWGTWVSGGVILRAIRFKTGLLPFKSIVTKSVLGFFVSGGLNNLSVSSSQPVITFVYNATFDALFIGAQNEARVGLPIEAAIAIANEINGPDLWMCIPHLATDDFVTNMAATVQSNLTAPLKWIQELSNEVWNPGAGFEQTPFAIATAKAKWSIADSNDGLNNWYGWRFYNIVQLINAQTSKVVRWFGFRTDGAFNVDQRIKAPQTGVPAFPITACDHMGFAGYVGMDSTTLSFPRAQDVYNYQQGILTSNSTLLNSALSGVDSCFNAPGCSPLFSPITASMSGTTLTVTAISNPGPPPSIAPFLGPFTAIDDFGGSAPLKGTYIISQLTGTPGGVGTYQVSLSQTNAGPTYTARGGDCYQLKNVYFPFWAGIATTYSKIVSQYEGGFGVLPINQNQPTSYLGNPLNFQDTMNLLVGYKNSSQWAASFLATINNFKAGGGTFYSQYQMTGVIDNNTNMFQMVQPTIFGPQPPQKTAAFDVYNAS